MTDQKSTIVIDYYTDMLCVWAWIAQPRLEELQRQWGSRIEIRHRFLDVFGDSHSKIKSRWGAEEGFRKFGTHVSEAAASIGGAETHPDLWTKMRPRSSMQSHLILKAVGQVAGESRMESMALRIRQAFFTQARDVSNLDFLLELAASENLDPEALAGNLRDGQAMAALSSDHREALELGVKGSPTWVINEGRQILYGNVGYRILNANIEELAKHPTAEASWC